MLCQRDAHSLDTWEQDELMPQDPLRTVSGEGSLVSRRILTALAGYKACALGAGEEKYVPGLPRRPYRVFSLAGLPQQLESLQMNWQGYFDVD